MPNTKTAIPFFIQKPPFPDFGNPALNSGFLQFCMLWYSTVYIGIYIIGSGIQWRKRNGKQHPCQEKVVMKTCQACGNRRRKNQFF
jgi:hypothetical protein